MCDILKGVTFFDFFVVIMISTKKYVKSMSNHDVFPMAVKVRCEPSRKVIIGDLTSSTSQTIDFAEVSEEIERACGDLRLVPTQGRTPSLYDRSREPLHPTVLPGGMIFGVFFRFRTSGPMRRIGIAKCAGCIIALRRVSGGGWCWYCGRYTRVVGYFFSHWTIRMYRT